MYFFACCFCCVFFSAHSDLQLISLSRALLHLRSRSLFGQPLFAQLVRAVRWEEEWGGGVVHCNCKRQAFSTELRAPFAPRATRIQRAKRKQQQRQWQRSQANKRTSQSGFLTRLSLALSLTLCSNVGQTPFLRGGGRRAAGAL